MNLLPESQRRVIALDYDDTYTVDPDMWLEIVKVMQARGHEVIVVTMRTPEELSGSQNFVEVDTRLRELIPRFVPTSRKAKKLFCGHFGIEVDIWIDDNPLFVLVDAKRV